MAGHTWLPPPARLHRRRSQSRAQTRPPPRIVLATTAGSEPAVVALRMITQPRRRQASPAPTAPRRPPDRAAHQPPRAGPGAAGRLTGRSHPARPQRPAAVHPRLRPHPRTAPPPSSHIDDMSYSLNPRIDARLRPPSLDYLMTPSVVAPTAIAVEPEAAQDSWTCRPRNGRPADPTRRASLPSIPGTARTPPLPAPTPPSHSATCRTHFLNESMESSTSPALDDQMSPQSRRPNRPRGRAQGGEGPPGRGEPAHRPHLAGTPRPAQTATLPGPGPDPATPAHRAGCHR